MTESSARPALPTASVVIITLNQREYLERSLPLIACQSDIDGAVETIVVDSGSTDGARSVVNAAGALLIDYGPHAFRYSRAYNRGIAAARGPIVVRLSGDAIPADCHWLSALLSPFSDSAVAAVWGRQIHPSGVRNPIERRFDARLRPNTARSYTHAVTPLGSGMALRRDLWEAYPFDDRLPQAEDYDWVHRWTRRGYTAIYTPDAVIRHGHDESIARALRRGLLQSVVQAKILGRR